MNILDCTLETVRVKLQLPWQLAFYYLGHPVSPATQTPMVKSCLIQARHNFYNGCTCGEYCRLSKQLLNKQNVSVDEEKGVCVCVCV